MRKLINGILIGFGSALFGIISATWHLLLRCLDSKYLIVGEAKFIEAAQMATIIGTLLGILLVATGLSFELIRGKALKSGR